MDKFYNVLITSLEIIKDRGFPISQNDLDIDYEIFKYRYNLYSTTDSYDHIFDFFYELPLKKIAFTYIKDYGDVKNTVDFLKDEHDLSSNDTLVLVLSNNEDIVGTKKIQKSLHDYYIKLGGCTVQIFRIDELAFNITKHNLVPHHRLMNPLEVDNLINKYSLSSVKQLPIMFVTDPISKYYNFKVGNVCEITRTNVLSGISKAHRLIL